MVCVDNIDAAMLSEEGTVATHGKSVLDKGSGAWWAWQRWAEEGPGVPSALSEGLVFGSK